MNSERIFNNVITIKEASQLTDTSERTIRDRCEKGRYQAEKREGTWIILKASVLGEDSPEIIRDRFDEMHDLLATDERYNVLTEYAYDCGQIPATLKDANLMLDFYNRLGADEDGPGIRFDQYSRCFSGIGVYLADYIILEQELDIE